MSYGLVSVVIPTYNRAHCIAETIDSVLAQTYQNFEILVVDDGSTDDTRALLERLYPDEPRLCYRHQRNQGVCAARNNGLGVAKGDYIALLDSDDVWQPWKLDLQLRCLEKLPEAGMIWTNMDAIDGDGNVTARRYLRTMYGAYKWFGTDDLFTSSRPLVDVAPALADEVGHGKLYLGDIFSQMIMGNLVHTSTVLLRRERFDKVKGFDVALARSGEDFDFHLRTCRAGPVAYADCSSLLYRWGLEDQLTSPAYAIDLATNFLKTITPVLRDDRDRIDLPESMIQEVLAGAHSWLGEESLKLGRGSVGRRHILQSLRHKPRQPRLLGMLALSLLPNRASDDIRSAYRRAKRLVQRS